MTNFNTDYNNTELLDQELSFDELQEINGGVAPVIPLLIAGGTAIGAYFWGERVKERAKKGQDMNDPKNLL